MNRRDIYLRLGLLFALVAFVLSLYAFSPVSISDFTPTNIRTFILRFGFWAPLALIALYAIRGLVPVLPTEVLTLAGGLAFGTWLGTLYVLIGATTGACLAFLVARFLGRDFVSRFKWMRAVCRQHIWTRCLLS
jgi:uncharacterized membrane protein YdjX (TVP38/TMEM64 family)